MNKFCSALLLAVTAHADEDPTGFRAEGASISKAKVTVYQGWNDLETKLVDKVHNDFSFTDGSTFASASGEIAEAWSCYKDGSSTYACVITSLSEPNTATESYKITQYMFSSSGKPSIQNDVQPSVSFASANKTKVSQLEFSVKGTTWTKGEVIINTSNEIMVVTNQSFADSNNFYSRYHRTKSMSGTTAL